MSSEFSSIVFMMYYLLSDSNVNIIFKFFYGSEMNGSFYLACQMRL